MATSSIMGSSVRSFTPAEIARFTRKDLATCRKWFERVPGVRKYPRGFGNQKPSLGIPELIARKRLLDIGYSEEEILAGLIEPHDRRLLEETRPQVEEPTPPAAPPKRAKTPIKNKTASQPGKRINSARRQRRPKK
jgi:hypothetical protein